MLQTKLTHTTQVVVDFAVEFLFQQAIKLNTLTHTSANGEVAEWTNVPDSKSGVLATVPWVRIPPSPPLNYSNLRPKPS